jgi:hypothetical protein
MLCISRQIRQIGRDPDIHGEHIEPHRSTALQPHTAGVKINARSAPKDKPRPNPPRKANKVHLKLLAPIMPGDMCRQHTGVGCHRIGIDKGQAGPRQRVHRPCTQHQRMRMPSAKKHKIACQGQVLHGSRVGQGFTLC